MGASLLALAKSIYYKETLHLNTFGEQGHRSQDCEVVKIRLTKPGCEDIELCALGFPVICSSLPGKFDVAKYSHLDNLLLADEYLMVTLMIPQTV